MANTKWILDPTHSEVQFKVKHLLVSKVTGHFKQFNVTVETQGDDISTAKVHFTADVNSISTNNEQRDAHLRSGDFFDTDNHPQLIFDSSKMEKTGDDTYKLHGTLTMRGVSKPIALDVTGGGVMQDPWGNTRTGFEITGKVDRTEYGVSFGMTSDTGAILLGHDVAIQASAEFVKEQALQPA